MRSPYIRFKLLIPILAVLIPAIFFAGLGPAQAAEPVRRGVNLVTSDRSRVTFEVSVEEWFLERSPTLEGAERLQIPGFISLSKPGEPRLPSRKFLIALPPEGGYSLRTTVVQSRNIGRHRLEPVATPFLIKEESGQSILSERIVMVDSVYFSTTQKPGVVADPIAHIRQQRVLPLWINPVSYDPNSGELSIAQKVRVEITFLQSEWGSGQEATRPVREHPSWGRVFSRVLLNPDQAREWRLKRETTPRFRRALDESRVAVPPDPLVKIKVAETNVQRVKAADLIAKGFPAGQATTNIRLFKRSYDPDSKIDTAVDVSFVIREDSGGTPDIFEGEDWLVFYGQRLRDDALQDDPVEKFADHNIYWVGADNGAAMEPVTMNRGYLTADTSSLAYEVLDRYEEDNHFHEETPKPVYPQSPLQQDSYFYGDDDLKVIDLPFSVHAMAPGTTLRIEAEFIGGNLGITTFRTLVMSIENSLGSVPLTGMVISRNNRRPYTSQEVPETDLVEGENRFLIMPSAERTKLNAIMNWFTVNYTSLYRARNDVLSFHSGALLGDTTISVTGLSKKDVMLFDVTNPHAPKLCELTDDLFTDVGGSYALSFRDAFSEKKQYVLTPFDLIPQVASEDVIADISPGRIIGHPLESGVDILVISHKDYISGMQAWVDYRRAQGYKVLMVDVEEVYDEFNSGVLNAVAIKRVINHYLELADASFVLLVGDASEDQKRVHDDSGINFVPTQTYPERIQAYPFNEDEVVASDKWYTLMGNDYLSGQTDYYSDIIIGRLPAGNVRELQAMLDKIFMYEKPQASDFWRRQMVMVADDAWSYAGLDMMSCYRSSEKGFEEGEDSAATVIDTSLAGNYDVVRFYLSKYTDKVHPPIGQCIHNSTVEEYARANALPDLLGYLNSGATLVSIQAHMNRYLITHETLFSSTFFARDHNKMANFERPFILFGMGCHLSDFTLYRELANHLTNDVNGDCIDELLLFLNNRGAVATYGSAGFEYLGENMDYTTGIHETFFNTPPTDTMIASNRAQARWIFGEIMTISEMTRARTGQIKRYHLLGDPLLRIDAGPPRFEVTVDGTPVQTGDILVTAGADSVSIEAIVSDENAIEDFELEIDGQDESGSLTRDALVDEALTASRQYRVAFKHKLIPKSYDIILRALQAPDTSGSEYHMSAEFVLKVPLDVDLTVNGRLIVDGEMVPHDGNYVINLGFPIVIEEDDIEVLMDNVPVAPLDLSHPSSEDSTSWIIGFASSLAEGEHEMTLRVQNNNIITYMLVVSSQTGVRQVVAYPNPFIDETYIVFDNEVTITSGSIDVFTTSGKRIASLDIPSNARQPGQNAILWDGKDFAGHAVANGIYFYILTVEQRGERHTFTGKVARMH